MKDRSLWVKPNKKIDTIEHNIDNIEITQSDKKPLLQKFSCTIIGSIIADIVTIKILKMTLLK